MKFQEVVHDSTARNMNFDSSFIMSTCKKPDFFTQFEIKGFKELDEKIEQLDKKIDEVKL